MALAQQTDPPASDLFSQNDETQTPLNIHAHFPA